MPFRLRFVAVAVVATIVACLRTPWMVVRGMIVGAAVVGVLAGLSFLTVLASGAAYMSMGATAKK